MKFTDRLKFAFGRMAVKINNISFLPDWVRATFLTPIFSNLVKEGVRVNSALFATLTVLTWGFGEAELRVFDGEGNDIPNHELKRLLDKPNPDMSGREFRKLLLLYAAISGNAFVWIQRDQLQRPIALWPLSDYNVYVEPGHTSKEGIVKYYVIKSSGGSNIEGTRISKDDMIHFKFMTDPLNPELGYGALQALAREIDTDNEMGTYVFSLLRNNAIPPVVVTLSEGEILDEDTATRLRESWRERLGGDNRGLPAFLESGMKVETLGADLNAMAYDAMRGVPESRISAALRVPAILSGLKVGLDASTYSNYSSAREAFTEDTLVPLWRSFAEVFQIKLISDDSDISIEFDLSEIRSLQDDVNEIWTRATNAWNSGLITRAEAKTLMGLDSVDSDDVYKVSGAVFFVRPGEDPNGFGTLAEPTLPEPDQEEPDQEDDDQAGTSTGDEDEPKSSQQANTKAVGASTLFAFWLPELVSAAKSLEGQPDIELVPSKNYHLTLAMVDGLVPEKIAKSALGVAFNQVDKVAVEFDGFESFKDSGAIYLRVNNTEEIRKFREALVHSLQMAGFEPATTFDFIPHVTVAYGAKEFDFELLDKFSYEPFTMSFETAEIIRTVDDQQTTRETFVPILKSINWNQMAIEEKLAREQARSWALALQRTRFAVAGRMQAAIDGYFENLADSVVARLYKASPGDQVETKISADDLIIPDDEDKLEDLIKRFYVELAVSSWETANMALGVNVDFDLRNPAVEKTLQSAGLRVRAISDTTLAKLREALEEGQRLGLSVDQLARGTEDFRGIRDIVEETYKNRARTIARTELGEAQNTVTIGRYEESGLVDQVIILDNGFEDSHETCTWIDGQIRPLAWTRADHSEGPSPDGVKNPLQHPNCVRTFAPYFPPRR